MIDSYQSYYQLPQRFNEHSANSHQQSVAIKDSPDVILGKLELAGRVPSKDKFRCMVCMTFVSCGGCPYNDRCVFIHDPRIKIEGVKLKASKQQKPAHNPPRDTFYWPDMLKKDVMRKVDTQGLPDANQKYIIPTSFATATNSSIASAMGAHAHSGSSINVPPSSVEHDRGIYSMWAHFVEMCMISNHFGATPNNYEDRTYFNSHDESNRYIKCDRLPTFVYLSNVLEDEYQYANTYSNNKFNNSYHNAMLMQKTSTRKEIIDLENYKINNVGNYNQYSNSNESISLSSPNGSIDSPRSVSSGGSYSAAAYGVEQQKQAHRDSINSLSPPTSSVSYGHTANMSWLLPPSQAFQSQRHLVEEPLPPASLSTSPPNAPNTHYNNHFHYQYQTNSNNSKRTSHSSHHNKSSSSASNYSNAIMNQQPLQYLSAPSAASAASIASAGNMSVASRTPTQCANGLFVDPYLLRSMESISVEQNRLTTLYQQQQQQQQQQSNLFYGAKATSSHLSAYHPSINTPNITYGNNIYLPFSASSASSNVLTPREYSPPAELDSTSLASAPHSYLLNK